MSRIRELLRRSDQRVALGTALVLVLGAGIGAVALSGGDDRSVEIGSGLVSNPAAGTSLTLPDGWQELPRVDRQRPPEVLVVGTAPRPTGEPIEACGGSNAVPDARSGYLTLYEYDAHGPFPSPTEETVYPYEAFQPRPASFSDMSGWVNECNSLRQFVPVIVTVPPSPTTTEPVDPTSTTIPDATTTSTIPVSLPPVPSPAVNHLRELAFTDGGRAFLARIVTVDDETGELLAQAYEILNSLRVDVPAVTTTTVYNGPGNEQTARQEIVDAMQAAFGTPSPVPFADSIEGGHPLATEAQKQAAAEIAKHADPVTRGAYQASQEGAIVVRINWIEWDSPTHATLNFDLLAHDQPITANTTGYAVYENGHWRMGRATWCEIAARGGVQCPS